MMNVKLDLFRRNLEQLIEPEDQVIAVNGGLLRIGHIFEIPPALLVPAILDVLVDVVGHGRTLVMSAYTPSFAKTRVFDLIQSKPSTGVLVEQFLKRPGVKRTAKPMNSYACFGPLADEISRLPCQPSWGDNGVMAYLERHQTRSIALGMPLEICCPYFHRGEEKYGTPYRYHKRFAGEIRHDGVAVGPCEETIFVRPLGIPTKVNYAPLTALLKREQRIAFGEQPLFSLAAAEVTDIVAATESLLAADPYIFVENRDEVATWVKNEKGHEIAAMKPDQRPSGILPEGCVSALG